MSIKLVNQLTAVNYPNDGSNVGTILGPSTLGFKLNLVVGNAPCLVSVATVMDPRAGPQAGYQWTDEIPIVAGAGQVVQQSYDGAVGFKAKDLIPGTHATIYAVVWEKGDPIPTDPVASAGTLSGSGLVPIGQSLNVQHNGALVGTQPTIDFIDAAGVSWTVSNDAANTRVLVTPVPTAGAFTQLTPGDPVGTGNGTPTMMGFAGSFIPTRTGRISISHVGAMETGSTGSALAQLYVGTGAAPGNGAAPPGGSSPVGSPLQAVLLASPDRWPIATMGLAALAVGTTYWFDLAIWRGGASSCTVFGNTLAAVEY